MDKEILDNGIILYKKKIENVNTIGICITAKIGSIYELDDKRGISHFLEHMMFKSNKKYTAEQINMGLELSGGIANASTSTFKTSYYVEVVPEGFEKVIDILYSMFENDKYKENEFQNEKKVILTEIERYENDPESRLYDLIPKSLYGKSDYGDPIAGFRETVESISKEDLEEFKAKYYTPQNMFILIEGNFNERHIDLIKKYFGKLEGEKIKLKEPSIKRGDHIIEYMNTKNQIYFALSYDVRNESFLDGLAFKKLISGGLSSLTFQIIREKYGIGYSVWFGNLYEYPDRTIFTLAIPGFERDKENVLDNAVNELFYTVETKDLNEYWRGRKRKMKLEYEKIKNNIFDRLEYDSLFIALFEKDLDQVYNEISKREFEEIREFIKYLKNGRKTIIYPR